MSEATPNRQRRRHPQTAMQLAARKLGPTQGFMAVAWAIEKCIAERAEGRELTVTEVAHFWEEGVTHTYRRRGLYREVFGTFVEIDLFDDDAKREIARWARRLKKMKRTVDDLEARADERQAAKVDLGYSVPAPVL